VKRSAALLALLVVLVGCGTMPTRKNNSELCPLPRNDPYASFYERHLNRDGLGVDTFNGFVPFAAIGVLADAIEKRIQKK
jgi:hypothetical protein